MAVLLKAIFLSSDFFQAVLANLHLSIPVSYEIETEKNIPKSFLHLDSHFFYILAMCISMIEILFEKSRRKITGLLKARGQPKQHFSLLAKAKC